MTHSIREATEADADEVVRLLDAAMLEFDRECARQRVEDESVLIATVAGHNRDERRSSGGSDTTAPDDRVVGACVLREPNGEPTEAKYSAWVSSGTEQVDAPPTEIEQIAVHRSRRGRGIGATLVDAAATRADGPLVAYFREQVRPFYESLGFDIREPDLDNTRSGRDDDNGDRLRGILR